MDLYLDTSLHLPSANVKTFMDENVCLHIRLINDGISLQITVIENDQTIRNPYKSA